MNGKGPDLESHGEHEVPIHKCSRTDSASIESAIFWIVLDVIEQCSMFKV